MVIYNIRYPMDNGGDVVQHLNFGHQLRGWKISQLDSISQGETSI